jgi:sigma-B regulation protein RsbU (phosphoserine phosphatase)
MVITKTLIKNNAFSGKSPKEVFETVNNMLCENNDKGMFVSAFMGYYNTENGMFVYANAGHNPPFLKKGENDYKMLEIKPDLVLGCNEDLVYKEEEITLEPGDTLYLYTDGVTEAMNSGRDLFTELRLLEALKKNRDCLPRELLSGIKHEIDSFACGAKQEDDITMLALKIMEYGKIELVEGLT